MVRKYKIKCKPMIIYLRMSLSVARSYILWYSPVLSLSPHLLLPAPLSLHLTLLIPPPLLPSAFYLPYYLPHTSLYTSYYLLLLSSLHPSKGNGSTLLFKTYVVLSDSYQLNFKPFKPTIHVLSTDCYANLAYYTTCYVYNVLMNCM